MLWEGLQWREGDKKGRRKKKTEMDRIRKKERDRQKDVFVIERVRERKERNEMARSDIYAS